MTAPAVGQDSIETLRPYIVAVFDILGQTEATLREPSLAADVVRTFREECVKRFEAPKAPRHWCVGDSFYVAIEASRRPDTIANLHTLLVLAAHVWERQAAVGTFIRGAIELGQATEMKVGVGDVIGPAVLAAYQLERAAGYPRIVIGERLMSEVSNVAWSRTKPDAVYALSCQRLLSKDTDGVWIINVASSELEPLLDDPGHSVGLAVAAIIAKINIESFRRSGRPEVAAKYEKLIQQLPSEKCHFPTPPPWAEGHLPAEASS